MIWGEGSGSLPCKRRVGEKQLMEKKGWLVGQ